MMSISPMGARRWAIYRLWVAVFLLLTACAPRHELPLKIALLAPFEGRYREVGYNALYAARLALADSGLPNIELMPLDDGGTVAAASERMQALTVDSTVRAVIVLGYVASNSLTQQAAADIPVLIVGYWGAHPQTDTVFILASPDLNLQMTTDSYVEVTDAAELDAPMVGGDVFALVQFPVLRPSLDGINIISSGNLPSADFRERYVNSDLFVPEPGLLATLTYDVTRIAIEAIAASNNRADATESLHTMTYSGINGDIRFENGYWANAPINRFVYNEIGQLIPANDIVE